MLDLTKDEIIALAQLVAQERTRKGEHLGSETPLNTMFQKLYDELYALNLVTAMQAAAQADDFTAKHEAEMARLAAEYPVKAGDVADVKINGKTYVAEVKSVSEGICDSWAHRNLNTRYLELVVLRKDGMPHKIMNGRLGVRRCQVRAEYIKKVA